MKSRQEKCSSEVVAYADRANERLRRKYYRMTLRGKKFNVAKTAIARELACFVWGIMTDHIDLCNWLYKELKQYLVTKKESRILDRKSL